MEDIKPAVHVLMTPQLMQLKINTAIIKEKLTVSELEKRALNIVVTEDNLKEAADLLKDLDKVDTIAEEVFKPLKKPYWDAGKACDAGKKLVLDQTTRIRSMPWKSRYEKILVELAEKKRQQDLKIVQDAAIKKNIEYNVINFSNRIVAAITKKQLQDVENAINVQKHPQMVKIYGEFHQLAIERFETVLIPIIKDQKKKVEILDGLNAEIQAAEANNDPDKIDELNAKVNAVSNEMLQNHAVVGDAALNQDFFATTDVVEVLPDFKVKRTNYSMEIADAAVAFKKVPHLLDISVNKEAAKEVLAKLKEGDAFANKDEVIVDGIKYIATRVREAL